MLKEGVVEDDANQERIAKLLRFASTQSETDDQTVSLADYVGRMKEGQDGDLLHHRRQLRRRAEQPAPRDLPQAGRRSAADVPTGSTSGCCRSLTEFDGKPLQSVAKGDLDLGKLGDEAASGRRSESQAGEYKPICSNGIKDVLGRPRERGARHRAADRFAGVPGRRRARHEHAPRAPAEGGRPEGRRQRKPMLEINPHHPIVAAAASARRTTRASPTGARSCSTRPCWPKAGNSRIPPAFVKRLNKLMLTLAGGGRVEDLDSWELTLTGLRPGDPGPGSQRARQAFGFGMGLSACLAV